MTKNIKGLKTCELINCVNDAFNEANIPQAYRNFSYRNIQHKIVDELDTLFLAKKQKYLDFVSHSNGILIYGNQSLDIEQTSYCIARSLVLFRKNVYCINFYDIKNENYSALFDIVRNIDCLFVCGISDIIQTDDTKNKIAELSYLIQRRLADDKFTFLSCPGITDFSCNKVPISNDVIGRIVNSFQTYIITGNTYKKINNKI